MRANQLQDLFYLKDIAHILRHHTLGQFSSHAWKLLNVDIRYQRLGSQLKTLDYWHNSMASVIWNRSPYLVVVIDLSLWNMKLPSAFGICNCHLWYLFWYFILRRSTSGGGWAGARVFSWFLPTLTRRTENSTFIHEFSNPTISGTQENHHQCWTSRSSGSVKEKNLIIIIAKTVPLIPKPT